MPPLGSDLSLALSTTSDTTTGEDCFVGRRKRTPLTVIPLHQKATLTIKTTRHHKHHGDGDKGCRNAEIKTRTNPVVDLTLFTLPKKTGADNAANGTGTGGVEGFVESAVPPSLPGSPSSKFYGDVVVGSPQHKTTRTSAVLTGLNHARTVDWLNDLKHETKNEMATADLLADLEPLRNFIQCHSRQVELWVTAFSNWDALLDTLIPGDLSNSPMPLAVADGELLLSILPSCSTMVYVRENKSVSKLKELQLTPLMHRLLVIDQLAAKAVTLTMCLTLLSHRRTALEQVNAYRTFINCVANSSVCQKVLASCVKQEPATSAASMISAESTVSTQLPSEEPPGPVSIWSLLAAVADDSRLATLRREWKQASRETGDFTDWTTDKMMDLIDQVDLEIALANAMVNIQMYQSSLHQSLMLISMVEARFNCSGRSSSTSLSNVDEKVKSIWLQVKQMGPLLAKEMHRKLGHLIQEVVQNRSSAPTPFGTVIKALVIFIEAVRQPAF